MSNSYPSVVFFDLDGTLIDNPFESAVWPVLFAELAAKSNQPPDLVRQLVMAENASRQVDEFFSPVAAMDWDDIAQSVADDLDVRLDASIESLVRAHAASHSSVLDDGEAVLREMTAPHRALVVATKGLARYQRPVLDALHLTDHFADILTPDAHNGLKKHLHFFGEWPRRTRLQIMVGDLYDDDVLYPSNHGFKTVWKQVHLPSGLENRDPFVRALRFPYTPDQPVPADAIIQSLAELPAVVRRFESMVLGFTDQ